MLGLHLEMRWDSDLTGPYLGLQPSTVHRFLFRDGAHRLSCLFPGRHPAASAASTCISG